MICKMDCDRPVLTVKSGLCSTHYHRERRGSKATRPPEAYHNFPSYSKAHSAVVALRGKARDYPCVSCLGPADHWSLMTLDGAQQDTWTSNKGRWFSNSIWNYSPMCQQDHYEYEQTFGISNGIRGKHKNGNPKKEPTG